MSTRGWNDRLITGFLDPVLLQDLLARPQALAPMGAADLYSLRLAPGADVVGHFRPPRPDHEPRLRKPCPCRITAVVPASMAATGARTRRRIGLRYRPRDLHSLRSSAFCAAASFHLHVGVGATKLRRCSASGLTRPGSVVAGRAGEAGEDLGAGSARAGYAGRATTCFASKSAIVSRVRGRGRRVGCVSATSAIRAAMR